MNSNYLMFLFLAGAGTVVLYEKTTTTEMNSTYGSAESTASDEEVGTVNYQFLFLTICY